MRIELLRACLYQSISDASFLASLAENAMSNVSSCILYSCYETMSNIIQAIKSCLHVFNAKGQDESVSQHRRPRGASRSYMVKTRPA